VDTGSIPFVLIYTPYRNIYGAVQDLKEDMDRRFNELQSDVSELKSDVSALNVTMGLVLELLIKKLT